MMGTSLKMQPARDSHVCHVAWTICDATRLRVLAVEDERGEALAVDPRDPAEDAQRREDPPRVANIA